jgi:hypothetical protein
VSAEHGPDLFPKIIHEAFGRLYRADTLQKEPHFPKLRRF